MDKFVFPRQKRTFPVSGDHVFCYSVGCYRGKKREVLAWFTTFHDANLFLERIVHDFPHLHFDVLNSMF